MLKSYHKSARNVLQIHPKEQKITLNKCHYPAVGILCASTYVKQHSFLYCRPE